MKPRPSVGPCQLIGSSSMVVRCAELILERGGEVRGLVSDIPATQEWAAGLRIPLASPEDDIAGFLGQTEFDHLFSVVNPHILPPQVLGLPSREAINFHDGPLPRYAGCNATSWAIFNGESRHGVTWHRMSSRIDAGDILRQVEVPISPLDTAFTLNVKCYEAGIAAFDLLLSDLAAGTPSGVAQDLSQRTFFGPAEIPGPPRLRWEQPAQRISQLIRALDPGPGRAVLASPSVLTPSGADVIVRTVTVLPEASGLPPGTVVSTGPGRLTVTTGSEDLALAGLRDADGRRVDVTALGEEFGISEGVALPAYREE